MLLTLCRRLAILGVVFIFTTFVASTPAFAQQKWTGQCVASGSLGQDVATLQGVQCLVRNILNVALTILAMIGFVVFVFAGLRLLVTGGQSSNLEAAKSTITFAVMGLTLAVSSFVILTIVSNITNTSNGENDIMTFQFLSDDAPASQ